MDKAVVFNTYFSSIPVLIHLFLLFSLCSIISTQQVVLWVYFAPKMRCMTSFALSQYNQVGRARRCFSQNAEGNNHINQSISQGVYPSDWKTAQIVCIPQKTDHSNPQNYRPISILSLISKVLEKHMHQLISDHLNEFCPISPRQFGFMSGRSTTTALHTFTHDLLSSFDEGNDACSIFKKAFDSVPHSH